MAQDATGSVESRKDFAQTPQGQFDYWNTQIEASQSMLEDWHKMGDNINGRYVDDRKMNQSMNRADSPRAFRLNMFNSNVKTLTSMLYGRLPKVEASRRNASQNDDVGRVAAETMERLLTLDLQTNGKEYDAVFRSVLQDRLLPGLGCARVRYDVETKKVAKVSNMDGSDYVEEEGADPEYDDEITKE